jgi:hypothetical protein
MTLSIAGSFALGALCFAAVMGIVWVGRVVIGNGAGSRY